MTLFAFGGAWLLRAQFGFSRRLRDLLLLGALLTLGLTTLFYRALPAALNLDAGGQFSAVGLWGELFVAAAFAAAAFAPADSLIAGGRPVLIVAILSVLAVALGELGGLFLGGQFGAVAAHGARGTIDAAQHPLELVVVLGTTGLFICGAVVFASRDRIDHDGLGRWLAGGAILLAATSLSHLGLPFPASQPVASRDAVRLLAFASLLAAAVRLELQLRKTAARAAAIAERRRVARDLHDGLAQDLALIAAHGARIAVRARRRAPGGDRRATRARRSHAARSPTCRIPGAATAHEALEAIAGELRDRFEIDDHARRRASAMSRPRGAARTWPDRARGDRKCGAARRRRARDRVAAAHRRRDVLCGSSTTAAGSKRSAR